MSIGRIGEYFDERAGGWDAQSEAAGGKHLAIARLAGVHEGARVLDIGCGTGIMERAYLELGASRILALDLSQGMIEHARAKFADVARAQLEFACADVLQLDTNERFDIVVAYNAYPHILDREALVERVSDLLVPEGRFLVAHGMGRKALDAHHAHVPANVSRELLPAREEATCWESRFDIDEVADTPFVYFFGGAKRRTSD